MTDMNDQQKMEMLSEFLVGIFKQNAKSLDSFINAIPKRPFPGVILFWHENDKFRVSVALDYEGPYLEQLAGVEFFVHESLAEAISLANGCPETPPQSH